VDAANLPDCPNYVAEADADLDGPDELPALWADLLRKVVGNLGHRKSNLRKLSLQVLRGFGARGLYADAVLSALQEWGLSDEDWRVRLHATLAVPVFVDEERAPRGRGLAPVLTRLAALLRDAELVAQAARQVVLDLHQVLGAALSEALSFVDPEAREALEEVFRSAEDLAREELQEEEFEYREFEVDLSGAEVSEQEVDLARQPLVVELSDEPSGLQPGPVESASDVTTPLPSPTAAPRILSTQVLESLEGLDWEQRCRGLQDLHETLSGTDFAKVELAERGEVMRVLNRLLGDAHFRIVLSTLTTVGDICGHWTHHVLPVFHDVVPGLVDRLVDHKAVIRQSCHRCFGKVFEAIGDIAQPKEFFQGFLTDTLLPHLTRDNWQMRKELFAVLVMAVLILRSAALTDPLLRAFCSGQKDRKPEVQACALEGLATASALGHDVLQTCAALLDADELAKVSVRLLGRRWSIAEHRRRPGNLPGHHHRREHTRVDGCGSAAEPPGHRGGSPVRRDRRGQGHVGALAGFERWWCVRSWTPRSEARTWIAVLGAAPWVAPALLAATKPRAARSLLIEADDAHDARARFGTVSWTSEGQLCEHAAAFAFWICPSARAETMEATLGWLQATATAATCAGGAEIVHSAWYRRRSVSGSLPASPLGST
jgi:hypothetical protein